VSTSPSVPVDSLVSSTAPSRVRRGASRLTAICSWLVLIGLLALWGILHAGDSWAPATFLMFGPRWVFLVPPVLLLPFALLFRRRALLAVVPALAAAAGPVMGFCVPWARLAGDGNGLRVRILTCNLHHSHIDPKSLKRLVDSFNPDVVALQEWRNPAQLVGFSNPHWHTHRVSGLFLASRYPIRRAERVSANSFDENGLVGRYELETAGKTLTVLSLHFASPREALAKTASGDAGGWDDIKTNTNIRWSQSRHVAAVAGRELGPVLVVGDFNTAPESAIFREVWPAYENAFSAAGWGWGYTFLIKRTAVRTDHILVGKGGRAVRSWVGPDVGSPHRPVVADVVWP
jgi:vancomycin resistance protein VanJ